MKRQSLWILLSAALSGAALSATTWAQQGPRSSPWGKSDDKPDPVRKKRHDQLAQTNKDLSSLCETINSWKLLGPMSAEADMDILRDPKSSAADRKRALKHLQSMDSDSGNLPEDKKGELRQSADQAKGQCQGLEDDDIGLAALTKDGVALEKIEKGLWEDFTGELSALVLSYQGKDAFGDSATCNYGNSYKGFDNGRGVMDAGSARLQLANDTLTHLGATVDRGTIKQAVDAAKVEAEKKP